MHEDRCFLVLTSGKFKHDWSDRWGSRWYDLDLYWLDRWLYCGDGVDGRHGFYVSTNDFAAYWFRLDTHHLTNV